MWKIFLVIKEDFEHFVNTLSRTKNAKNLFRSTYFFKQFHCCHEPFTQKSPLAAIFKIRLTKKI